MDDLDESSLAVWWNIDKTINLDSNTTPFRKQRYEPLKWANAHLLLEEDGAEFLADDPFATPAPRLKSAKKPSSARKRNSNAAAGYPKSSSRMSAGSHRDLTLADLTPRSRRLSGFRGHAAQRARVSDANTRPLRLSFNGPSFTANPHQALEVIQEQHSRQIDSPALPAFRPLTLERPPVSPYKTGARTPTHQPRPSDPKSIGNGKKQKRKSGGDSMPSAQVLRVEESEDEELHKSIPGAFDFVASERFQPEPALPTIVLEQKAPRKSKEASKPRPSTQSSEPANGGLAGMLADYGDSLMGLLGSNTVQPIAQRQSRNSPSLKLSDLSPRKLAAVRPSISHETKLNVQTAGKVVTRAVIPKATTSRSARKPVPPASPSPSPAKSRPSVKAPTVFNLQAPSRLQKPSQGQFSTKPLSISSHKSLPAPPLATQVKEHALERPIRQNMKAQTEPTGRTSPPPQQAERVKPRSSSRPRPSSTVQLEVPPPTEDVPRFEETAASVGITDIFSYQTIKPVHNVRHARPSETLSSTKAFLTRNSHMSSPSPQGMRLDPPSPSLSPTKRVLPPASPRKSRPSSSCATVSIPSNSHAVTEAPVVIVDVPPKKVPAAPIPPIVSAAPIAIATTGVQPAQHILKPILKKRVLELSPAKVALDGRAKKRQKVSEIMMVTTVKKTMQSKSAEQKAVAEEKGRTAVSRRAKMEQAPRKQTGRSRSRINKEVPVLDSLILSGVATSPEHRPSRPRSRGRDVGPPGQRMDMRNQSRSQSRLRHSENTRMYPVTQNPSDGLEEDVFGTVVEISLEVVNATKVTPREHFPPMVLESMSPIPRQEEPVHVPQHRQERVTANQYEPVYRTAPVLLPTTAHNSPKRARSPVARKPPSPVRIDYRPPPVEYIDENLFVSRSHRVDRDEGACRLTIPVSPKFTHIRRERVREQRERPVKPIIVERPTRAKQREMPPVAAALLAKLAGVEADLTSRQSRGKAVAAPTIGAHPFTFRAELRPALRQDAAVLADHALKQQFESRRNLWEQRSLEASQESRTSSLGHSRSTSAQQQAQTRHGPEMAQVRYPLATSSRAAQREARRDQRRREGVQREERLARVPWGHPPGGRGNHPW